MATANSTGTPSVQGLCAARSDINKASEREKISCPLASLGEPELLNLRGKRIRVLQTFEYSAMAPFVAQVLAVHLPASGSGIETSVLLCEDGLSSDQSDYVDVSHLQLIEVLQ